MLTAGTVNVVDNNSIDSNNNYKLLMLVIMLLIVIIMKHPACITFQAKWFTHIVTFKLPEVLCDRKVLLFSFYGRNWR